MNQESIIVKMKEVVDLVASDIGTIRTGRATPALVEDLVVPVYGGQQRLKVNELATLSAPDQQTLTIEPWDKSIIGEIRQGILSANIGMNPSIDGEIIRISMPPLTREDKEKYVKLLSKKIEAGRVMVRQVRGEAMQKIKDSFEKKEMSEDEKFGEEKSLQEITDEYVKKVEDMGEAKKKELLQV